MKAGHKVEGTSKKMVGMGRRGAASKGRLGESIAAKKKRERGVFTGTQ